MEWRECLEELFLGGDGEKETFTIPQGRFMSDSEDFWSLRSLLSIEQRAHGLGA